MYNYSFSDIGPRNTRPAVLELDLASGNKKGFPTPQASLEGGEESQTELEGKKTQLPQHVR